MDVLLDDYTGKGMLWLGEGKFSAALVMRGFYIKTTNKVPKSLSEITKDLNDSILSSSMSKIAQLNMTSCLEPVRITLSIEGVSQRFISQLSKIKGSDMSIQETESTGIDQLESLKGQTVSLPIGGNSSVITKVNSDFDQHISNCNSLYHGLVANGVNVSDAIGILPLHTKTNCMISMNLRTYLYVLRKRSSSVYKGEFKEIIDKSLPLIRDAFPWVSYFLDTDLVYCVDDLKTSLIDMERFGQSMTQELLNAMLAKIEKIEEIL